MLIDRSPVQLWPDSPIFKIMKICPHCKKEKNNNEFNKNRNRPDGLAIQCKICIQKMQKAHYIKSEKRRKSVEYRRINSKQNSKNIIYKHLINNPCINCGETDPIILQFHHVKGKKIFAIANAIRLGINIENLKNEISKCEILCSNCHLKKTAQKNGYWIVNFKPSFLLDSDE